MKIIFDNVIFSLQRAGGISNYWMELIKAVSAKESLHMLEYEDACDNVFRSANVVDETKITMVGKRPGISRYLPLRLKALNCSIFHSSYYRPLASRNGVKIVTTLHDFIYEHHVTGLKKIIHTWQKKKALMQADAIICISEHTRNDLLKFYPECGIKDIAVIYNGVSNDFCVASIAKAERMDDLVAVPAQKFALFVGDRAPYKNFRFAVDVIAKRADFHLIVVGGKPVTDEEKGYLEEKIPGRYIFKKGIRNDELNILYNRAAFLLYPSSYEGFGMPVIEAMKAGCPVLALNKSSVAEIAAGYPLLMSDATLEEAAKTLQYLDANRDEVVALGLKIGGRYSWEKCTSETLDFYKTILNKK